MKSSDKTRGLKYAAQMKRQDTIARVNDAIAKMQMEHKDINFATVANAAKVSRTWLYLQDNFKRQIKKAKLANKIKELKNTTKSSGSNDSSKPISRNEKLEMRIKILKKENAELKKQLELLYGKLYQQK